MPGLIIGLEEERTVLFANQTRSEAFTKLEITAKVITSSCLIYHLFYAVFIFLRSWFATNRDKRLVKRRRILLFNLVTSSLCEGVILLGLFAPLSWQACSLVLRLPVIFFANANFASYLVLLERSDAVHHSILAGKWDVLLKKVVKLGTLTVPVLSVFTPLIVEGKLYFEEGVCIQVLSAAISWFFTVTDSSLSFGYLILFLAPVLRQVKNLSSLDMAAGMNPTMESDKKSLQRVAKRNLKYSLATILATFVHMVVTSSAATIMELNSSSEVAHLALLEYITGPLDLVILSRVNLTLLRSCWQRPSKTRDNRSTIATR